MKKILVSDYDDTFYLNDEDIKSNVEYVNKYKEQLLFIIATGRSYHDYLKKQKKYNINSEYIILNHGATIIEDEKIIYNEIIDDNIKNELIEFLNIEESSEYFCCSGLESRVPYTNNNLTKIHINYGDESKTRRIFEELNDKFSKYINCFLVSKNNAIEIVSNKANKKYAILKLIELRKIDSDYIYTIGNGDTDYEMLNYFNGYKMENCSNKLKKLNIESVKSIKDLIKQIVN